MGVLIYETDSAFLAVYKNDANSHSVSIKMKGQD